MTLGDHPAPARSHSRAGVTLCVLFALLLAAGTWGCTRSGVELEGSPTEVLLHDSANQTAAVEKSQDDPAAEQEPAEEPEPAGELAPPPAAQLPLQHPYPRRIDIPEFPRQAEWVNTGGPIQLHDLQGKFVLLDFWTYCCINCMHLIPELKELEESYPNNLVVIGVHSAKFETEEDTQNIREAILRYGIQHPVVNDANHVIWETLGISAWPTTVLIDPAGQAVYARSGEWEAAEIAAIIDRGLPYYRQEGLLDETPLQLDIISEAQPETPLRFPSKVLADQASGRLFIADTGHQRIVIASFEGELQAVVGGGEAGFANGDYRAARFNDPHGMALVGDSLYVADTGNHAIRRIDLANQQVETVAGTGEKAEGPWPGEQRGIEATGPDDWQGPALQTALASPWALWPAGDELFIAMAGRHQIWRLRLATSEVGLYAGNGREDIVDGPMTPPRRYEAGYASFAQPSGLTSDGERLFVADSEGSSIRVVPLKGAGDVTTLVGTDHLPFNRLFSFGDLDGPPGTARFQHPLGVSWHEGVIYVADTYNDAIRTVDAATGEVATLHLTDGADSADISRLDEPEGLSFAGRRLYVADTNRHRIVSISPVEGEENLWFVMPLTIDGLQPPEQVPAARRPDFSGAALHELEPVAVAAGGDPPTLAIELSLPEGWKLNPLGPMAYFQEAHGPDGPLTGEGLGELVRLREPSQHLEIPLPAAALAADEVRVSLRYFYCQEGAEGLCRAGAVTWVVPLAAGEAAQAQVPLEHFVPVE